MREFIKLVEGMVTDDAVEERRRNMRGKALNGLFFIYRACAEGELAFKPMDYVTRNKKFAIEHAAHMAAVEGEPYHVIKLLADGVDVFEAPNPGEYFYDGRAKTGKVLMSHDQIMAQMDEE